MKKSMLLFTLLLVCLPLIDAEAAKVLPIDLYPNNEDLAGRWFLFPQVKAVLLTVIILGILTEVKTAGAGIAGGIAIIAAAALFGMNFVSGVGSWLEVLLFIVGMGLLILEVFVPGFGLFGIAGILSILASFYFVLGGNASALNWLAISIVAALTLFALLIKYLPSNPAWNLFVLKDKQENSERYSVTPDLTQYAGKSGVAVTTLRPAGIALIDGIRIDVVTFGDYIDAGTNIVVDKVEGSKIFVKKQAKEE